MKERNLNREIALVALLDDPNEEIFKDVKSEILKIGTQLIPFLQESFEKSDDGLHKLRLSEILDLLKLKHLKSEIVNWGKKETYSLLKGLLLVAKFGYPNLNEEVINETIQLIAKELKPLTEGKSNYEIMQAMNSIILDKYKFGDNYNNYININNSFINKAIEDKVGNPIMISIIYLLVAKELNINIIGINSPKHFILAILQETGNEVTMYNDELIHQVDFYIDPFNKGVFYSKENYDSELRKIGVSFKDKALLPATNLDIVKRVMNNLIYALHTSGEKMAAKNLLKIVDLL